MPRYLACSSVTSERWASNVGRWRLATYSSEIIRMEWLSCLNEMRRTRKEMTVQGYWRWGLAHLLWQQVDVLLVSSFWSAVQLYESQNLTNSNINTTAGDNSPPQRDRVTDTSPLKHLRKNNTLNLKHIIVPELWRWWRGQMRALWSSTDSVSGPEWKKLTWNSVSSHCWYPKHIWKWIISNRPQVSLCLSCCTPDISRKGSDQVNRMCSFTYFKALWEKFGICYFGLYKI